MDRLTLNRRPKTGDKVECLPAGDGLPVWTTIPLDAKLPMMQNPRGSVILYTTRLGQPKHRCKQEYDFDLRDPNGKYISNEYHPLHDPHLKSYFSKEVMRRHLIKKGFISENGKVLCSLKEFNQYRQYLRHIFFLEIAKERKEELDKRLSTSDDKTEFQRKASRGTVIRRRLQQQRERDIDVLRKNLNVKAEKVENRLKAIREEMIAREHKQRDEAERRQLAVYKNQQEAEQRNLILIKRWRHKDRLRKRLIEDREAQRKIQAEMKCLEKWNERKMSQKERLERQGHIQQQDDDHRMQSIARRERTVNRQREALENKIEALKQRTRERKHARDELYAKRFEEKLASGNYRKWTRSRDKRNKHRRTFNSSWALKDVLKNLQLTDIGKGDIGSPKQKHIPDIRADDMLNPDLDEDEQLKQKAREIVDGVLEKVKNEIYPAYLRSIGEDDGLLCSKEATPSKSVRFSNEEDEINPDLPVHLPPKYGEGIDIIDFQEEAKFRPVAEHILTPCASQLEVQKLEAEAILGSPEIRDKTSSVSFVETLLLRLLDDLNSGRLRKEDIMKLASYSMEIIQSTETETMKNITIMEENEMEGPSVASSSSSIIAKKLVDFTLTRILTDIMSGNVHHDDLASLTVSLVDISGGGDEGSTSLSVSDADLDEYIDETIRAATASAMDPREDSPVCDALLDNFMVNTLKRLIKDLEEEALTKEQIETLAKSVREETKALTESTDMHLRDLGDIRFVLETLLAQLKAGDIDSQSLYQIVFAIVYSYSIIKSPPTPSYEGKVTELLKEVLNKAENKASCGNLDMINQNIVHEANNRLSLTSLDINQIEKISSSIVSLSAKTNVVCKTSTSEIARSIVEDALMKAKQQIEQDDLDQGLQEGVQNIAEAVILTLAPESESPPLVDVFVEILEKLKENVETSDLRNTDKFEDLCELIEKVKAHSIGPDEVADMASTVVEVVKSPVKSESSVTAFYVVKDTLKSIRDDFVKGVIEESIIKEMIDMISFSCKSLLMSDPKSPALLTCLSAFIRSILNLLSLKLQTGELNQLDLAELSKIVRDRLETGITRSQVTEEDDEISMLVHADNVIDYLSYLIDNIETGEMNNDEIKDLGNKLIESGKHLMASVSEKVSSINTDEAAEGAVEEVLRTIQMEIESGVLTKESLKEMTKSIIISSSDSDFADELVSGAIKSIERDVERGYAVKDLPSLPTLDHSPSASTIASYVVIQTIDEIRKNISEKGIPIEMVQSVASSLLSHLSSRKIDIGSLPSEFERHRNTIVNMITCLKDDRISVVEAEKIFCLILERYGTFIHGKGEKVEKYEGLNQDDALLVEDLVNETLHHIERSVACGKIFNKEFSIPSEASSDNTSKIASNVVETCLQSLKQHLLEEEAVVARRSVDIVDFVIAIVKQLKLELAKGSISSLSMATFFRSISAATDNLKELEVNALNNLSAILYDIETERSDSVYINRILDTYLTPDQASMSVLTDPVKAVELILVNVSSEILTKFVKATLENIIMDIRDGSSRQQLERESSTYVLRTTSSVIAENAIKKVLEKVHEDLGNSLQSHKGTGLSRTKLEKAASKLLGSETPTSTSLENAMSTEKLASMSQPSSSVSAKGVEDIVLETLHNIVSNLRFEQSVHDKEDKRVDDETDSEVSREIHDFVLQTLQNIVTDLQDRRSQIDMGVLKTENCDEVVTRELTSKHSIQATTYVNEILHTVLHDMRSEMSTRASNSTGGCEQGIKQKSPLQLESSIIETLIKVLSGTTLQKHSSVLEERQRDNIKKILTESIKQTILHVKEGRFNEVEILSMYESLSKCLDEPDGQMDEEESVSHVQGKVISILLSLSAKVDSISVNDDMLDKLSSHLATIGMDIHSENASTADVVSNSSLASSEISELVTDIISKISNQLVNETQSKSMEEYPGKTESGTDNVTKVIDKTVTDKNFNRRNSASSSCQSTLTKDNSGISCTSLHVTLPKHTLSEGSASSSTETLESKDPNGMGTEKKVNRQSFESKDQIKTLGKQEERLLTRRSMPKPKFQIPQGISLTSAKSCMQSTSTKVKKDTPIPTNCRVSRKPDKLLFPKNNRGQMYSQYSSSTPNRASDNKARVTTRPKFQSPDRVRQSPENLVSKRSMPIVTPPEEPFELKSLCGVHKTRIRYRNTIEAESDSTTDDGSFTSELF